MDFKTVEKLNAINKEFYIKTATHFDSSRSYNWGGWEIFWELLLNDPQFNKRLSKCSVLDIGCGNGRFLGFLESKGWSGRYTGFDSSEELINFANERYSNENAHFEIRDIMETLDSVIKEKYDLVVCFGVMHHIPGKENRIKLMNFMKNSLGEKGRVVLAFWKFMNSPKYQKRVVPFSEVWIDPSEVEEGDYILDWQRGVNAYRYCHHVSEEEEVSLISGSGLNTSDMYMSDGKDQSLNKYLLLNAV